MEQRIGEAHQHARAFRVRPGDLFKPATLKDEFLQRIISMMVQSLKAQSNAAKRLRQLSGSLVLLEMGCPEQLKRANFHAPHT